MKRRWTFAWPLAAASIVMTSAPACAQSQAADSSRAAPVDAQRVDALVAAAMKAFGTPGVSVGIVKDGKLVFAKGYGVGDMGDPVPVTPETIFAIGSNTKAFTAAAFALLVDEGKIGWDDKVIDHLPDFRMYDPYVTREFTIRDLLTHRSGLPAYAGDLLFVPATDFTREDVIRTLRHLKPSSSFRSRYAYDNLLYVVAGQIIPAVTGQSWEDFVETRLLRRLGMAPCAVNRSRLESGTSAAAPHSMVGSALQKVAPDDLEMVGPAGSIQCNIPGMAKWMNMLLADGGDAVGKPLLSKAQSLELWTPQTLLPVDREGLAAAAGMRFQSYGLGWTVADMRGQTLVYHDGEVGGMSSMVALLPESRFGVVVLANQQHQATKIAITLQIVETVLGGGDQDWVKLLRQATDLEDDQVRKISAQVETVLSGKAATPALPLSAYAGTYVDAWRGDVAVRLGKDGLVMTFSRTKGLEGRLYPYSGDVFVVKWNDRSLNADAFVRFSQDFGRQVEGFTMRAVSPTTDPSFDFRDLNFRKRKN